MEDLQALDISGDLPPKFAQAFASLAKKLNFVQSGNGYPVVLKKGGAGVRLEKTAEGAVLYWQKPVHLYRGLSLLRQVWAQPDYRITETPCFETLAVMLDVSRNAVLKVNSIKSILEQMALMGVNLVMMYTEDTYEIPEYPYFGWMRGSYSVDEMQEMDDYADMLGIEMCPCIQTLGHLNRVLHWPAMAHLKDNEEVLLEGQEDTYDFLRRSIIAATKPFRSRRINICMDEAHGVGLGEHLRRCGYENPHTIIKRHLSRVMAITDELGLSVMMYSDMFFRPDSPTGGYYDSGEPTAESIASVPENVMLLYWDYYNQDQKIYDDMLRKHKVLGAPTGFVGGVWTWGGPAPSYDKTVATALPGLKAAKAAGLPFVMATAWGDNGAEANMRTALLGFQLYAEFNYRGAFDQAELINRFRVCCHGDAKAFYDLSEFNTVPGMKSGDLRPVNAAKFLLYQDPLVQLYEKDTEGLAMADHYQDLADKFAAYEISAAPEDTELFAFYVQLARVLAGKCRWHENIGPVVRRGDKETAASLARSLTTVGVQVQELRRLWCKLWNATNKPFGFEIIDGRLGAVTARLDTARERTLQWAEGDGPAPAELLEPQLPYTRMADGALFGSYAVGEIVSACKIDI